MGKCVIIFTMFAPLKWEQKDYRTENGNAATGVVSEEYTDFTCNW